jgi:BirA family biotin operon repressor/biotin-[acetyl-CoA-carboxylase] ligase
MALFDPERFKALAALPNLQVMYLPVISSTNTWLMECASDLPHFTICIADEQTGGRGTYGRKWYAEPGENLTFSVLLEQVEPFVATLCAMQSWHAVLEKSAPGKLFLKWPNDLVSGGLKLGGVLTETVSKYGRLVTGMGININQIVFPEDVPGISLAVLCGRFFEREALLAQWCEAFSSRLERWEKDREQMLNDCARRFLGFNSVVKAGGMQGIFCGLSHSGMPVLEIDGKHIEINDYGVRLQ